MSGGLTNKMKVRPRWYRALIQSWESSDDEFTSSIGDISVHLDEHCWQRYLDEVKRLNREYVLHTHVIPNIYDKPQGLPSDVMVPVSIWNRLIKSFDGSIRLSSHQYVMLTVINHVYYVIDMVTYKRHESCFQQEYKILNKDVE